MLTITQKNNINKILGFSLTSQQIEDAELKTAYFFNGKVEYKIKIKPKVTTLNIISIIQSKRFPVNQLKLSMPIYNILILYRAPTPALYHVNRKLFGWSWYMYDIDSGVCIYETNNKKTPDITSHLYG